MDEAEKYETLKAIADLEDIGALRSYVARGGPLSFAAPRHEPVLSWNEWGWGASEVFSEAIRLGAPVNARDSGGYTPLHSACMCNDTAKISALIEAGASLDAVAGNGLTPMLAWYIDSNDDYREERALELLLRAGADRDIRDPTGRAMMDHARAELAAGVTVDDDCPPEKIIEMLETVFPDAAHPDVKVALE